MLQYQTMLKLIKVLYLVNYDVQSYNKLLKMQPQNVQMLFQDLKQAPQLFGKKTKWKIREAVEQ